MERPSRLYEQMVNVQSKRKETSLSPRPRLVDLTSRPQYLGIVLSFSCGQVSFSCWRPDECVESSHMQNDLFG